MIAANTPIVSINPQLDNRVIRVFLSSTFGDMQRERELLFKEIFPDLRRICAERFVTFTAIDLRKDIREEQSAEDKILPISLEEISLSRPYFIGILGEYYGLKPEPVSVEILARESWLKEPMNNGASVTELEFLHGVLNNPVNQENVFFCFRDPKYLETLSDKEREEMMEQDVPKDIPLFNDGETVQLTQNRKDKLAALKQRIRESGLPLLENYSEPKALADAVHGHFIKLIDQLYPDNNAPDFLDQEKHLCEIYARNKLLVFAPRSAHITILDAFVDNKSTGKGLVITGESGSGKTTLLANWIRSRQKSHADEFFFEHYFGATPRSATISNFLERLMGEVKKLADIPDEIPATKDRMIEELPLWLGQATNKSKVIIVLDALNLIQGDDRDKRLEWLPLHLRSHLRVVISATPSKALNYLRQRGWQEHQLPLANINERIEIIETFSNHYQVALKKDMQQQLASANSSANLICIRTVLEEIRRIERFYQLPTDIFRYLEATSPVALFRLVLKCWQHDYDADCDLVRRTMRHILAARQGLTETELLELLCTPTGSLPRKNLTPLFLAMEPYLTQCYGLFSFSNDFFRSAAELEFLNTDTDRRSAHLALADYFGKQPVVIRNCIELAWQLRAAEKRDRLKELLVNILMFLILFKHDETELIGYWKWLGMERIMGALYLEAFERILGDDERPEVALIANKLFLFLHKASLHKEAEQLIRRALSINEQRLGKDDIGVAVCLNNLVAMLKDSNRFDEAVPLMRRALQIEEQNNGKDHPIVASSLIGLAQLLAEVNRPAEAEPLMRRALIIDEQSFGKDHIKVASDLDDLARLLFDSGKLKEAEPLMARALYIDEKNYGKDHTKVAGDLNNLGQLLKAANRLTEAEPLMLRALQIAEQSYGEDHTRVATCLNNLADLLAANNKFFEAEPLMRRALNISEKCFEKDDPRLAIPLNNLATLFCNTDRLVEAEPLMRRGLSITESVYGKNHPILATQLNNLAQLLAAVNRKSEAEPLLQRALVIFITIGRETDHRHPNLNDIANIYANLLYDLGWTQEQIHNKLYEIAPDVFEGPVGKTKPQSADLNKRAEDFIKKGEMSDAERLMREAIQMDEQRYGKIHSEVANDLNNLALFLQRTYPDDPKRIAEAEVLLTRALNISEERYGKNHSTVAAYLSNLALLFSETQRPAQAESMMRRALSISEERFGKDDPKVAIQLNNLGSFLRANKRFAEAEPLMRRSLMILLASSLKAGNPDSNLDGVGNNYAFLLIDMGWTMQQIQDRISDISQGFTVKEVKEKK